tara:strand:+ start:239 stop:700 length:462 start_codon:yes stop_codon:yes gene_type:complete
MFYKNTNNRLFYILLSLIIFLCDQFTKYFINNNYPKLINKNFIFFSIDYVRNYGAAFNLFSGSRIFLSIISITISLFLVYLIFRKASSSNLEILSYSFILAGSLANGLDRIVKGYVIDFINLNFIDFPVFNIADISINIGFILILYSFIKCKS